MYIKDKGNKKEQSGSEEGKKGLRDGGRNSREKKYEKKER